MSLSPLAAFGLYIEHKRSEFGDQTDSVILHEVQKYYDNCHNYAYGGSASNLDSFYLITERALLVCENIYQTTKRKYFSFRELTEIWLDCYEKAIMNGEKLTL